MDLKVKPAEVEQFARALHEWSAQLRNLHGQVRGKTDALQRHWDDPQFKMFVEVINGHAANVDLSVKSFEEMSATLAKMARSMEDNIRQQQRMLESLNRRR